MLFGIGTGVQTFSFGINKVMGSCSDFAANYLDDIIVFSRTAEDHLKHLEQVFAALQKADLKIKASKCEFFKSHACYLGFLIGELESDVIDPRSKLSTKSTPMSIEEMR